MKRIAKWYKIVFVLAALLVIGRGIQLAQAAPLADEDVDALIANAESAGTSVIAKDATILTWDADGMPSVVLREGTNGWTCLSDWPVSPGNDPQCFDPIWEAWNKAYAAGEEPEVTGLGIGYMLQGGSDPSNTDPMAMEPAAGEDWVTSPPHIMFLMPDGFDADFFSTTPSDSVPYIMWDGTPYEHLMVPVVAISAEEMGDASDEMMSAMSAAPAEIALNATIMGNPEKAGDPMVVLQEGTNGWICYPDGTGSPGNDPACQDPDFDAGFANAATRDVPHLSIGHMLQGGSDPSNTDPTLSAPAEGEDWVSTPPHVMVMIPGGFDADYFTTDHHSGYPYIMFAGTDYEHMMIPVADMPEMDMAAAHAAEIEQMKAEAIEMELLTFDLMIAQDWDAYAALTHPDFYQFGADGGYIERDAALAGLMAPELVVHRPNLGEMRVLVIAPNAYMVTYHLTFNGSWDGFEFRNPRTVASLWVKEDSEWQNLFLVEQIRDAPFVETIASRIANAERAAPSVIAQNATIIDWAEDGSPSVILREGTNGWTCVTDWPVSPGNDPQCNDPNWQKWSTAFAAGEEPEITGVGIAYMLAGGSDPSNTDPMAMETAEGEDWVTTPPHVMLLFPGGFDAEHFGTEPKQDEPYIMWDGTPYEHLMIPVVAMGAEAMGDVSAEIVSAMSSAPASIAQNATIMGKPEKEGDPMVVLQEGTNGWVCYPDRAVSPGDDPSCNDAIMDAGFASGATRDISGPGLGYMLAGGSDESNTDPTASGPAEGEDWVTTPPHLMLMVPGGFDADYFTTDHMSGYPYIMFAGTDYEHMMIPVADMPADHEMDQMHSGPVVLSVDSAGGDDSFATIQEALTHAAEIAPDQSVTIEVAPGAYLGPIVIDRANTVLVGLSGPQYDHDGYLIGFDMPVSITIATDLAKAENIIDIRADNVTVSGFSIDGAGYKTDDLNGGIGVNVITPEIHLRGLVISDNIVENMGDTAIYTHQADAAITRNRSVTPGFLGFNASGSAADGDAEVTVEKNWFVNKELGICMIGSVWDSFDRGDEFGPAGIVIAIRGNHLANNTPFFGWMDGHGLYLPAIMPRPYYNPSQDVTLRGEITGNTFANSAGAAFVVRAGPSEEGGGQFHTELLLDNNTFEGNHSIAKITFQTDAGYAHDSSITIVDADQAIPQDDIDAADLGPTDNKNTVVVTHTAP